MVYPIAIIATIRIVTWVCTEELFTTNSMPLYALKDFKYSETHWLGY
jgi:hypothetical protein